MKKICLIIISALLSFSVVGQKVIFLHHSTGEGVYNGGIGLTQWFTNYNSSHSTNYQISEQAYPNSPYAWANYAYDYWKLWVSPGNCDNNQSGIRCIDYYTSRYNVIIFKHCYPGANVAADDGQPNVSSSTQTIANYKLQYRALRTMMDGYPNNKFIVWTLAPLHRLATDEATAARAREFVNWVKTDWLHEEGKSHPNIFVFDFYGYAAESNANTTHDDLNRLKYAYEGSHTSNDSHPNSTANTTIMPLFGQFIVDVIQNQASSVSDLNGNEKPDIKFYPNPTQNYIKVDGIKQIQAIEIFSLSGKLIQKYEKPSDVINVSSLPKGAYIVKAFKDSKCSSQILLID